MELKLEIENLKEFLLFSRLPVSLDSLTTFQQKKTQRNSGRELLHLQGLQFSDLVMSKLSENQMVDLSGNAWPGNM